MQSKMACNLLRTAITLGLIIAKRSDELQHVKERRGSAEILY